MTWDRGIFHGHIMLTADRRRGVVAIESVRRSGRTFRSAMQAPTSTSAHGLIAIGLTTALRIWPQPKYVDRITEKFSILVTVDDRTFVQALTALINKDAEQIAVTPLRAGQNFLRPLAQQLVRKNVSFNSAADDDESFKALRLWARSHVKDPKEFREAALYQPVAVSELVWF